MRGLLVTSIGTSKQDPKLEAHSAGAAVLHRQKLLAGIVSTPVHSVSRPGTNG